MSEKRLRKSDPVLAAVIDRVGPIADAERGRRDRPEEHYAALVRTIIGQQVSTKAARAIWNRFLDYFGGDGPPSPGAVLAADPDEMRTAAGLSRPKASYLRSLAEHVIDGSLELDRLHELPDEVVIEELVAVKGLGVWSAHMFLMFRLDRPDVLPVGDLGIRRAVMNEYGLVELPKPDELTVIAEPWRPDRTLACRYLWRSLDATPVT